MPRCTATAQRIASLLDIEFVEQPGIDARQVGGKLIGRISEMQLREWSSGTPAVGRWKLSLSLGMTLTDCCRDPMTEVDIRCRWPR
jgi:hypothetical protein